MIMLVRKAEQYDPGLFRCSKIRPLHPQGRFGDPLRKVMGDCDNRPADRHVRRRIVGRCSVLRAKLPHTFVLEGAKGIRGRANESSVDYSRGLTSCIGSNAGGGAR